MKRRNIILGIVIFVSIIWAFVIFKFSSINTIDSNGASRDIISIILEKGLEFTNDLGITNSHPSESKLEHASSLLNSPLRKVMHASIYFVLAFIIIIAVNMFFKNKKYLFSFLITIIFCFSYALSDEYHQTFVEGRTGQFMDVIIDTTGAIFGCLFYGTYYLAYSLGKKSDEEEDNIDLLDN